MKLTSKIISVAFLVIIVLLAIDGYLSVRREVALFDKDMKSDALLLGRTIKTMVIESWKTLGQNRTMELIDQANKNQQAIRIRWVWLDAESAGPFSPEISRADLTPVFHGQEISVKTLHPGKDGYRYTYVPVATAPARHGAIELSESLKMLNDYTRETIGRSLILGVLMLGVSGLLLWVLGTRGIGRPLYQLVEKTRRIGDGDLSGELVFKGRDELSTLAAAMNRMCLRLAASQNAVRAESEARIAALEQLRHAERLSVLGRLSSGVAHELGTPLNIILGRAKMISSSELERQGLIDCAGIIVEQTNRITKIIRQFLDYARPRAPQKSPVDLKLMIIKVIEMLALTADKQNVSFEVLASDDLPIIFIDYFQIQQALINLIINAIQAMPNGGHLKLGLHLERGEFLSQGKMRAGEYLSVDVQDEGPGIAEDVIQDIFEPFFSTKNAGQGTGLGLSIADGIVREHGGKIDAKNCSDGGACFTVCLPLQVNGEQDRL